MRTAIFVGRAYVLRHGELVAEGRVSDLARDRHLLEARYLGEVAP
jgi:ABC-type lipopolysaccharide export system ATPase subunit